jgi:hypothetical protein
MLTMTSMTKYHEITGLTNSKFLLVKREHKTFYKFRFGFALMIITFLSCSEDPGKTGLALLPTGDLVVVSKATDSNIKSFIATDEIQRTDESSYNLLGTFNDPVFGKTLADFACQYRLTAFPEFLKNARIDSLVLYLAYKEIYGDTLTPQNIKIYELAQDIPYDDKFYQNTDLKAMSYGEVLGEKIYIPKFRLDSLTNNYGSTNKIPKDTVTQEVAIRMSETLVNKLVSADSITYTKNDLFLKYFKGLYIEVKDQSQEGTLMKILGSGMVMYFHSTVVKDSTFTYRNNTSASRVSRFVHDYSTATFAANLDTELNKDSLIYVQTTGGIRSKILIPNLGIWSKLIPELANDPDTAHFTINKAELIFKLDTMFSQPKDFRPSEQLFLAAIDSKGKTYLPQDYSFSPAYYGGTYNIKDRTYRFNIAQHIQDVIDKKEGKENNGFYLQTAYMNSTSRRAVLKGATSKTGIRLEITYSKVK